MNGGSHLSSTLDNSGERQLKAHDEKGVVVATIEADGEETASGRPLLFCVVRRVRGRSFRVLLFVRGS